ncbi:MAG TPA: hypothetical protein VFG69_21285 [Nannocystaceae bacterium]|nr:hypothetical protein [Nannocystaceae bacterium]
MADPDLARPILARLTALLATPVVDAGTTTALAGRDLVGGVVAARGTWWGVVIVRSDRELARRIADGCTPPETIDASMRRIAGELAHVVVQELDPTAKLSAPVVLAADNATWVPEIAWLQARVEVHVHAQLFVVEVHRRRRSDEIPTTGAGTASGTSA